MEARTKGECIEWAIESLMQLQDCALDAVGWLEKSKAFVPDESKTVQELKDALAKSIEREGELELELAAALAKVRRLHTYVRGVLAISAQAESVLADVSQIGRNLDKPLAVGGQPKPEPATVTPTGSGKATEPRWYMQWIEPEPSTLIGPSPTKPSDPPNRRAPLL